MDIHHPIDLKWVRGKGATVRWQALEDRDI
jgi:hypothetical protein